MNTEQTSKKIFTYIKKHTYNAEDTPLISKQKEIFSELAAERLEKIVDLEKKMI